MATLTKAERSEATRGELVRVARELFGTRGYADTSIEEIVRRARVTRGALYHHFSGKRDLFRAVNEDLGRELVETVEAAAAAEPRPEKHLDVGCNAFLDVCLEPSVQRIALLDAPSVLGWETWRELDERYGLALLTRALEAAMDADYIERQPVQPLAHLILGALGEAGLLLARADDVATARAEVGATVQRLLAGLRPAARAAG